ncbi:MAG: hypothetical protein E7012_00175 [Alphaproteobacteria bacterium]|nr:hypothetical protein [Alphaproteobacteria bacterium]
MSKQSSNPNIEWKKDKKGVGETEKLTRKTNIKKALEYEATEKKPVNTKDILKITELPKGIKKLRKRIKEAYEEDDEEEYTDVIPLNMESSLYNALYENEKKHIQQQNTIKNQIMQQTVGKMEAVLQADKMIKETGLKGINRKNANLTTQDVSIQDQPLEKIISKEAAEKTKSYNKILSTKETINVLRGIERIRKMALAADESQTKILEKMKLEEVINAGEKNTDDKEVAELILKKSGRKNKKDVKKIVNKSKQYSKPKVKDTRKTKDTVLNDLTTRDIHRN